MYLSWKWQKKKKKNLISGSLSEQSLREKAICTHPVVELSVVCLEFNQNIFSSPGNKQVL